MYREFRPCVDRCLEQAVDLSGFRVNVDVQVTRCGGQTGDGLNISRESVSNEGNRG